MKGRNLSEGGMRGNRPKPTIDTLVKRGKILIFCLLIAVEIVLAVNNGGAVVAGVRAVWIIVSMEGLLTGINAIKYWALKSFRQKIVCYVFDLLLLLVLTYFSDGALISILYIVILSEFYLSQESLSGNVAMGVCSIVMFLTMFAISNALKNETVNVVVLVTNMFNDLILLVLHFLIINFTLQIYRKNREIAKTLEELHESNEKLRLANEELKTVTALEERQRIAKDIHDTAGHSITTVIMQTEAAKLAIDGNPEEAKRKIISANLQAKHALEELRESVHLLSGSREKQTLKEALLDIVHESTDGTDIVIRTDVDDISLCDAKSRFLLNTLKEGISNGLRHGGATAFYFELKREGHKIRFLLSDNGAGMELSAFREGFGLSGMHERAESLGGIVWFETEPDEGFEIHITLPADGGEETGGNL